jgi:hypothetical protein
MDSANPDLDKEVRRLKRIASEWAGQLHDLVEDRLPAAYEELPEITRNTYEACKAWADASARLLSAKADNTPTENP